MKDNLQSGQLSNVPCEFVTGSAGCGKTHLLRQRLLDDPLYAILCSTTGVSAINLGCSTINSTLGYYDTPSLEQSVNKGWVQKRLIKLIKAGIKNLAVDEISMMPADQLDLIHDAIAEVNEGAKRPLGIVVVGDYLQLQPVKAEFAFHADCWERFAANTTRLTKMWRQTDNQFLEALNHLRSGNGEAAIDVLKSITRFHPMRDFHFDGTTILGKNDEVERHNRLAMRRLRGKVITVGSRRWGRQGGEWRLIPDKLELKVGALVMILANDSSRGGIFTYANGDCGHVEDFDGTHFLIRLIRNDAVVRIGKIHRTHQTRDEPEELSVEEWPEASGLNIPFGKVSFDEERGVWHDGGVLYYPLRVAYSSTVHKVQSLSLDRIQFDFTGHFAGNPASVYTAVSRCKTPGGLRLVGDEKTFVKRVQVHPEVLPYL